jgi:hypothetical protein
MNFWRGFLGGCLRLWGEILENPKEPQGTPRNPKEPQGTPRCRPEGAALRFAMSRAGWWRQLGCRWSFCFGVRLGKRGSWISALHGALVLRAFGYWDYAGYFFARRACSTMPGMSLSLRARAGTSEIARGGNRECEALRQSGGVCRQLCEG